MKRFIAALFLSIIGLSLSAQPKEILDYGKIKACFSFKDGTVLYEDEIMPEKFMSYLLIGENTIFVTSEFFDKRLEIPYDICTEENNDYNFTSFKTSERVVVNMSDGEVYYFKRQDKGEIKVALCAELDVVKTLALMKVLKFLP